MKKLNSIPLKRRYIVIGLLITVALGVLFPLMTSLSSSETEIDCASDNPTVLDAVQDIKDRLHEVGLDDRQFMRSTGVDKHIERLCSGDVTSDLLYTYSDQIESLNEIGRQYGQVIPATIWDVQTPEMLKNGDTEYQTVDTIVNSKPEYAQLLIRAYNRFYSFKQNSTADTALDTALDMFLYTVEYYDQITDADFDTMDEETAYETGVEIVRTWQQMIGNTLRINPLTNKPIFPYSMFSHLTVTDMWRHQTRSGNSIGRIWGVSGFDTRFVGDRHNSNQVEHIAISITLQYADKTPLLMLNAFEIQDTLSGGQTSVMGTADQAVNDAIAHEFVPYFAEDYVWTIEHLRCILSNVESASCT